ncbi:hypothetical protein DFQ14_103230 [Halopolyspora algeriensis]|uniref:Uncharacterized protein n=1 Tax=Halopolyspora algeriensis TaxID=1500506 RepID=A0A368VVN5_9ACTN|nr:hypothetical protein [Halopolyspora algeriensis]RCW45263.1 hypothetical protein DFQ14_103230 [Halopolyspora algeriensis]TQM53018.1 hypothetical protein FHU43_2394 [Halopolyspora algeriensis]
MPTCEQSQRLARPGRWAALTGALAGSLVVITSAVALSGTTEAGLTDSEVVLEYTVTGPGKEPDTVPPPDRGAQPGVPSSNPARTAAPSASAERPGTGDEQRSRPPSQSGDRPTQSRSADGGQQTSGQTSPATAPTQQPDSQQPAEGSVSTRTAEEVPSDGTEQ